MFTESGLENLKAYLHSDSLVQDGGLQDNLTNAQRQLLYWHRRLAHMDMEKIKTFARQDLLPKDIANAKTPLCPSCIQAKQTRTSISRNATGNSIKKDNLRPGDKISCDHFMSREPGIICNNYGKILNKDHATCGSLFIDHASDYIFCFIQTSTSGEQTVEAKHKFETFAKNCNVTIKYYHADNRIFNSQIFKESCITNQQTQSFCGVNAHHQNAIAENKIRTVISLARAMLFNSMMKWPNAIHLGYWPFAVHYAVEILNNTPKPSGFTPKEIFTGTKGDRNFKHYHTFGCPAYVLDPALQAGHKIPNWQPRSKPCIFVGKSRQHAASVSMTVNPETNVVSPNFHVVYDDDF